MLRICCLARLPSRRLYAASTSSRTLTSSSSDGDDQEPKKCDDEKTKDVKIERRPRKRSSKSNLQHSDPSVFVSAHYEVSGREVEDYLERHGVRCKTSGDHVILETCPFCHATHGKRDNLWKCYVARVNGVFFCHRCSSKGTWWTLKRKIGGMTEKDVVDFDASTAIRPVGRPKRNSAKTKTVKRPSTAEWKKQKVGLMEPTSPVKAMLNGTRGLSDSVITKYGMGAAYSNFLEDDDTWQQHLCYMFPMFNEKGALVRYKVRSIERKSAMRMEPKGGEWGLFGLQTVSKGSKEVVLTEGEFDAMAVHQATGMPAVSLPNGASSLPVAILPTLERFEKIYLWMDSDVPGQEGVMQFAKKLGLRRCYAVKCSAKAKDANDALLQNLDLRSMLEHASRVPHEGVATFADLREAVYNEVANPIQAQGIGSTILPNLNTLLKGHRRGELTIVSGHTGVGKTTLLSQMSLDYCMQGMPTLWGSFEISNVRLAKLLLFQYYSLESGRHISCLKDEFDKWAEKFETLPMYFMRYYGSNPIDKVLDAMEYANYVHDCAHVLLDNLQFMTAGQARGYERFDVMDQSVEKLRRFATNSHSHVSLVVHPRKENDCDKIQTASVFGSAKATQEADNLIILQRTATGPVLDVRKNRFDGSLGTLPLRFDSEAKIFEELDAPRRKIQRHIQEFTTEGQDESIKERPQKKKLRSQNPR